MVTLLVTDIPFLHLLTVIVLTAGWVGSSIITNYSWRRQERHRNFELEDLNGLTEEFHDLLKNSRGILIPRSVPSA
ncbi:hypothetical protein CCP3SC15_2540003 [Gammaproteobacteria bacterium]